MFRIVRIVIGHALERFTNPFYMLSLAFVVWAFQKLFGPDSPVTVSDKDAFATFWALVVTAVSAIFVLYMGPEEKMLRRLADVVAVFVSLTIGTFTVWIRYASLVTGTMVARELARSVIYTVNSIVGILIAQGLIFLGAFLVRAIGRRWNRLRTPPQA